MSGKVTLYHEASKGGYKQWSIWIEPDGQTVTVEWGLVDGRKQCSSDTAKPKGKPGTKSYKDEATCARENYERQLRKKREEGYREAFTRKEQATEDWLMGLDKNFVPAKPVTKISDEEAAAGLADGHLWAQRKRDGRRVLALKTRDGEWRLYTRRIEEVTGHLSGIAANLSTLTVPNGTIFDGEIVVDRDGDDDFRATGTFMNPAMSADDAAERQVALVQSGASIIFYVFDVLWYDGNPCWALPYSERYDLLSRGVPSRRPKWVSVQRAQVFEDLSLDALRQMVIERRWEGLILWDSTRGTEVRHGGKPKRRNCAKWKPIKEQDFIATGYFLGSGELSSVGGGLTLAEYAPDGTLRDCGKVGTGFDAETRADMMTWTYPCVVSVKFDSQEPTAKLRFPVFLKKHEDKVPSDCVGIELSSDDEE